MARSLTALILLALGMPVLASAEAEFRHGRIRSADDGVSIQRGTETTSEEAAANLPYLPGDRVWTDGNSRVEFQFTGGSTLRLDRGSKLDYVAHDDGRPERIVLRLWSGGLYLHAEQRDGAFELETPGGIVTADGGVLRIDAESGETRLSVYEGEARLDDQRLQAGERVYARDGRVEDPAGFDRAETDDFDAWSEEQESQFAYAPAERRLPAELSTYEGELDAQGVWYYEASIGQQVWRPHVDVGWRPYSDGRWAWTSYGWTWVPGERWGWATAHYGRWGFAPVTGWYWMPSAGWGPAWVSWAVGGDYVGWCPLGYGNRPVVINNVTIVNNNFRGRAASRNSWTYARRGDLSARDLSRRRMDRIDPAVARGLRVIENPHQARLARDLSVTAPRPTFVGGGSSGDSRENPRARTLRTKPTMADTVPEMRRDPTTPPYPGTRRRTGTDEVDPSLRAYPRRRTDVAADEAHPTDARADGRVPVSRRPADASSSDDDRARRRRTNDDSTEPAPRGDARVRERGRDRDDDRDALRPVFRPLSRPRTDDGGSSYVPRRSDPRTEPREPRAEPRAEPRRERPEPRTETREPRSEPRSEPRAESREPRRERSEPRAEPRSEPRREQPRTPPPSRAPADSSSGHGHARHRDQ